MWKNVTVTGRPPGGSTAARIIGWASTSNSSVASFLANGSAALSMASSRAQNTFDAIDHQLADCDHIPPIALARPALSMDLPHARPEPAPATPPRLCRVFVEPASNPGRRP